MSDTGRRGTVLLGLALGMFCACLRAEEIVPSQLDPAFAEAREKAFIPWCQQEESSAYWKTLSPTNIPIYNEKKPGGWMRDIYLPREKAGYWVLNGLSKEELLNEDKERRLRGFELVGAALSRDEGGRDNYWALWVGSGHADLVRAKMRALGIAPARIDPAAPDGSIPIDASSAFTFRPFSTMMAGRLVPLNGDVDGAGGMATAGAAKAQGSDDPHALPDDGRFPADGRRPETVLPYASDDGRKNLARRSQGNDSFSFSVPPARYGKLFLFLSSGQGPSDITVELLYDDGTSETRTAQVPDWFQDLKPDDPDWVYLARDLSKWGPDRMLEKSHHAIFGLDAHPTPGKPLTAVMVRKEAKGILAFYGAVGEAAP